MVDFNVFDSILDAAFVVDGEGIIQYTNDAGATFCQSSVRRLVGKAKISDLMSFAEAGILPFNENSLGWTSPTPFIETEFQLLKTAHQGKVQLTVRPVDKQCWAFFLRDVSLEEALHSKYRAELAQKEEYARNLEKLVEARTAELRRVNQTLNSILDSLGQGFFTFDIQGNCGPVYTKACLNVLEGAPTHRKAWEVLGVAKTEEGQFKMWMDSLFKECLPFEDLKELGPGLYPHSKQQRISLDYYPVRNESHITDVVVVATDRTAEYKAQRALEAERQFASMIVKYTKNRYQFMQFLQSVSGTFKKLRELSAVSFSKREIEESLRILHTLEGEAGIFSIGDIRESARHSQQILSAPRANASLISNDVLPAYLDSLSVMEKKFENLISSNRDIFAVPKGEVERMVELPYRHLRTFISDLKKSDNSENLVRRFQDLFLRVPLRERFLAFDGLVQTVAERLGKKVKPLRLEGQDIFIFPEYYEAFFSTLVHAFRNAVDHGLELPEERECSGKEVAGEIRVQFLETPNGFRIVVADDGRGLDSEKIRAKLREKFPERSFSQQSDQEVIQNVFLPGFSSRESVGEFSGRGVGLDALKEEVLKLGGQIHIKSKTGEGAELDILLPQISPENVSLRSA